MDVLFVNPDSSAKAYQGLAATYSAIEPPTWSLLLAESCRSKGFSVGIEAWQAYFTNPDYLNLVERRFGLQERKNVEHMATIKLKRKILGD